MHYVLVLDELVDEDDEPYGYYGIDPIDEGALGWPWLHGERFDGEPNVPVEFRVDLDDEYAGGFSDFVDGSIPLVSKKLRNVLESCGVSNIDYYPVKVAGAEEFDEFLEYFAENVVGLVKPTEPVTLTAKTFRAIGADKSDKLQVHSVAVGN